MSSHTTEHTNENPAHGHEPNYREPVLVFFGLVLLTIATVGFSGITPNALVAVIIALSIATVKASLVAWYFMHLKYEKPIFKVFLSVALGTFVILLVLLFSDYIYRSL